MRKLLLIGLSILFLTILSTSVLAASAYWVDDPTLCPATDETEFPGQECSDPDYICGDDGGTAQCYDMTSVSAPSPQIVTSTNPTGSYNGGFLVNCFADDDGSAPACDNSGNYWCDYNSTCYSTYHRKTNCTDWGVGPCAGCRDNYYYCDGSYTDADGCEVQDGGSCGSATGTYDGTCDGASGNCTSTTNADCDDDDGDGDINTCNGGNGCEIVSGASCGSGTGTYQENTCIGAGGNCTSSGTTYDCDDDDGDGDLYTCNGANGCEITEGAACVSAGLPGIYSGCTCTINKTKFETGTKANYSTADPLLWGQQFGTGWLINFTNSTNHTWGVNHGGCISFVDGTTQCTAGMPAGSVEDTQKTTSGLYLYNDTTTIYFNDTRMNLSIFSLERMWQLNTTTIINQSSQLTFNYSFFSLWDTDLTDDVNKSTQFGGDVSGTYDSIVVLDNSHQLHWENITNKPADLEDGDTYWDPNTTTLINQSAKLTFNETYFYNWDINLSDDINKSTQFGGDVSGTYDAIEIGDDTHNHSWYNITDRPAGLDDGDDDTQKSTTGPFLYNDTTNIYLNGTFLDEGFLNISSGSTNNIFSNNYWFGDNNFLGNITIYNTDADFLHVNGSLEMKDLFGRTTIMLNGTSGNVTINGSLKLSDLKSCDSLDTDSSGILTCGSDANTQKTTSGLYLYNDSTTIYFNDTRMNLSIFELERMWQLNTTTLINQSSQLTFNETYFNTFDKDYTDDVNESTEFGGDVSGTYDAIVVLDNSHQLHWENITNKPADLEDGDTYWDPNTTTLINQSAKLTFNETYFYNWDINLSDDVNKSTQFGGDVSGTYDAITVTDDSHNHSWYNITDRPSGLDDGDDERDTSGLYLYNDSTTIYFNDTRMNLSIFELERMWDISTSNYMNNDSGILDIDESALNTTISNRTGWRLIGGNASTNFDVDIQATLNSTLIYEDGSRVCTADNGICVDSGKDTNRFYLYNDTTTIFFNESQLNDTIQALESYGWDISTSTYLYNNSGILEVNETRLNQTINNRTGWRLIDGNASTDSDVLIRGMINITGSSVSGFGSSIEMPDAFYIGKNAASTGSSSIAMGTKANAAANDAVTIGPDANSKSSATSSVVIGYSAVAKGLYGVSLGSLSNASNQYGIAIGSISKSSGIGAITLGSNNAMSNGTGSIAIGETSYANKSYSIAIGMNSIAAAQNSLAIGYDSYNALANSANFSVNIYENGSRVCTADNGICANVDTQKTTSGLYLWNDTTTIYFNDTKMNLSIFELERMWDISTSTYLYNNSGILEVNESALNLSIDAKQRLWNLTGSTYLYNNSGILEVNETALNLSIDKKEKLWEISGSEYLYNNSGTLAVNDTAMNDTIDTRRYDYTKYEDGDEVTLVFNI